MELAELKSVLSNSEELIKKIRDEKQVPTGTLTEYLNQYNPKKHNIFDTTNRPDKIITTDEGVSSVKVARIGISMQKKIVQLAAAFLCGNPIELSSNPENDQEKNLLEVITRTWQQNKLDYDSKSIAEILMSETEVAELWYIEEASKNYWKGTANDSAAIQFRMRMKILANSKGDTLYPVFNNSGDMIAFGREYALKVEGKEIGHFDIYTDESVIKLTKSSSTWVREDAKHRFDKIPVVYYAQPVPEWSDVQEMIDRLEYMISGLCDTNDYNGSPILFVQGDIEGFSKKGEKGKVMVGKDNATIQYLSWDQSPESTKLEYNILRSLMYDMTDTPDISLEQMKGLGTYSGIALKMLFLAAHLKAARKEENFGKGIQRRINLIKATMPIINAKMESASWMDIKPKFEYYLPKDTEAWINMLQTASGGPVLSQETAVRLNPLVTDADSEVKKVNEAAKQENIQPQL